MIRLSAFSWYWNSTPGLRYQPNTDKWFPTFSGAPVRVSRTTKPCQLDLQKHLIIYPKSIQHLSNLFINRCKNNLQRCRQGNMKKTSNLHPKTSSKPFQNLSKNLSESDAKIGERPLPAPLVRRDSHPWWMSRPPLTERWVRLCVFRGTPCVAK